MENFRCLDRGVTYQCYRELWGLVAYGNLNFCSGWDDRVKVWEFLGFCFS